jgi:2-polyprenyl-3-methyl-5-hydroxy-6-metoxy-1,4-benzoquinol methylase
MSLTPPVTRDSDLSSKRVLILVVAYNAEMAFEKVFARIPSNLTSEKIEVLIIDDSSSGLKCEPPGSVVKTTVLRTPENQGHGGNQKLGFQYAIDNNFDIVVLVHGDRQYAPEKLTQLIGPLVRGEADGVFGSRMLDKREALRAGIPFYKWIGNQLLTAFQNRALGARFSEFDSLYRAYSTRALAQIPFEKNTNDFHFDMEIIIQFLLKKLRIIEVPLPAFYGNEIRGLNGLRYAWNAVKSTIRARLCGLHLFYDRKFDVQSVEEVYDIKLGFASSHTTAIAAAKPGAKILDVGCGQGQVAAELVKCGCRVTGMDRHIPPKSRAPRNIDFIQWDLDRSDFPVNVSQFDQIFLLDIIEHLKDPGHFMDELRFASDCKRPEIILTTANIGFIATRLMLLMGQFNYGKKGILDVTHTRLFTFQSIGELLTQSGYKILEVRGIPAPFPVALGYTFLARTLLWLNRKLIRLSKGLFAYQIFIRAEAKPTVNNLLRETIGSSALKPEAGSLQNMERAQQVFRDKFVERILNSQSNVLPQFDGADRCDASNEHGAAIPPKWRG